jgi:LAO/AO transport system kinase
MGITGIPGVGKSTFIDAFGMHLVAQGHRVAVLAVDPSSRLTGGSILGDKTRMPRLAAEAQAFIRPSPAGNSLGGVTRRTREAILLCEAAGHDRIIVETVGVGQSETAVHGMVDFFLLLLLAGDELQGIKKGIMEMATVVAVNKADGENELRAKRARAEFEAALHFFPAQEDGWQPQVVTCSGLQGQGLSDIATLSEQHRAMLSANGWLARRRAEQAQAWMDDAVLDLLREDFAAASGIQELAAQLAQLVRSGNVSPTVAARRLVAQYRATRM